MLQVDSSYVVFEERTWFRRSEDCSVGELDLTLLRARELLRKAGAELDSEAPPPTSRSRTLLLECLADLASYVAQRPLISMEAQSTEDGGAVLIADNASSRRRVTIEVASDGGSCVAKKVSDAGVTKRTLVSPADAVEEFRWLGGV